MRRTFSSPLAKLAGEPLPERPKPLPIHDDDSPWEPDPSFEHVFIRVNAHGECIISGPQDQVAQVRQQLIECLSEGRADQIPGNVRRFEFRE
jgi:hypothetical protein